MNETIRKAIFGSPDRPLSIGPMKIPCYVLEDGTRVLSGRGMQEALSLGQSHGSKLKRFLYYSNLIPFIDNELAMALENPIRFIRPGRGGKTAMGYEATVLVDICQMILRARDAKALRGEKQQAIAYQCEVLTRAFAKVGIIALVDEATGYQEVRDRLALDKLLEKYIAKELGPWTKRFPDEFYQVMFHLKDWEWKGMKVNRPSIVGHYTNDLVYNRLAPGVLDQLRKLNPPDISGRRPHKHHQWLTEDIGHPALANHLIGLTALMRASKDWDVFMRLAKRAYPKTGDQGDLDFED